MKKESKARMFVVSAVILSAAAFVIISQTFPSPPLSRFGFHQVPDEKITAKGNPVEYEFTTNDEGLLEFLRKSDAIYGMIDISRDDWEEMNAYLAETFANGVPVPRLLFSGEYVLENEPIHAAIATKTLNPARNGYYAVEIAITR